MTGLSDIIKIFEKFPESWKESAAKAAFQKDQPIVERLSELSIHMSKVAPQILCDRLASILRNDLLSLKNIPEEQYEHLTRCLIQKISEVFNNITFSWNRKPIFVENISEIIIWCEPPFEILNGKFNSYSTLESQLEIETLQKITYLFKNESYKVKFENFIRESISDEILEKNILRTKKITTPSSSLYPFCLYKGIDKSWCGIKGLHHPTTSPTDNGKYELESALSKDWASYMNQREIEEQLKVFNSLIVQER